MKHNKKTAFHKYLQVLLLEQDFDGGIMGLCKETGIKYRTMRDRLLYPRSLRWYEYISIVDALRLDAAQEARLQASIKGVAA